MRARSGDKVLWVAGLLAALLIAGVVSFYASSAPDGLERVAEDNGISEQASEHPAAGSPLADYQTSGVDDARLSGGLAGVIGVGVVLLLAGGLTWAVRRRGTGAPDDGDGPAPDPANRASTHGG